MTQHRSHPLWVLHKEEMRPGGLWPPAARENVHPTMSADRPAPPWAAAISDLASPPRGYDKAPTGKQRAEPGAVPAHPEPIASVGIWERRRGAAVTRSPEPRLTVRHRDPARRLVPHSSPRWTVCLCPLRHCVPAVSQQNAYFWSPHCSVSPTLPDDLTPRL